MNPRERFLASLHGQSPDRPPVAHVAALTTVELQELTGCTMPEAHHDPAGQARLLFANHEVLGLDAVTFLINFFNTPAALGVDMDWGDSATLPVFKSHPWRSMDDALVPADLLDRQPIRNCLETLRIAKRDYGDKIAVLGKVMGPFSMVQVMHGIENTLLAAIDDRDLLAGFMDTCVEMLVRFANAQFEIGVDAIGIGEGGAGAKMLSPKMYEEILMPVHQRMLGQIDGPTVMHMCGDITARLPMLKQTAMTCFNFDWAIPPKTMVAEAGGAFRLMGNANTADLLMGTPERIEQQVVECLEAGVDIISPGCAISPKCPIANLRAMTDAVIAHTSPT